MPPTVPSPPKARLRKKKPLPFPRRYHKKIQDYFTHAEGRQPCFAVQSYDDLKEVFRCADQRIGDYTIEEYGELVREQNGGVSPTELETRDGVTFYSHTYTKEDTGETYYYLSTFHKANDSFWIVQFGTLNTNLDKYEENFFKWAKSVKFE